MTLHPFELTGADGKQIRGDRAYGAGRQILFITGFLSKRWGNKSKALSQWCEEQGWGFCCYDVRGFGDSEGTFADYILSDWIADARSVISMLTTSSGHTRPTPARQDAPFPGHTRPTPASSHPPAPSLPSQAPAPGDAPFPDLTKPTPPRQGAVSANLTHPTPTRERAPFPPLTIVGNSLGGWIAWLMAQECDQVERLVLIAPAFNMMGVRARTISSERRHDWHSAGWMPWDDDPLHRDWPLSWKWVEESESYWTSSFDRMRRVRTSLLHGSGDSVIAPEGSREFVELLRRRDPSYPVELHLVAGDHRLNGPEHMEHLHRLLLEPVV
jgi:pimeloyl-ACP methyl ester carboxylesterase